MNWQHRVTGLRSSDLQRQYNDVVCTARERFKRNGKRCSLILTLFDFSGCRQFELRLARIMCSHVHSKRELTDCCDLRH